MSTQVEAIEGDDTADSVSLCPSQSIIWFQRAALCSQQNREAESDIIQISAANSGPAREQFTTLGLIVGASCGFETEQFCHQDVC